MSVPPLQLLALLALDPEVYEQSHSSAEVERNMARLRRGIKAGCRLVEEEVPTVPSLQLLALMAIDPDRVAHSIHAFASENESESSSKASAEEEDSSIVHAKDALRHVLTFAGNLRCAVAEEADSLRIKCSNDHEEAYTIDEPVLITDVPLAKLPGSCELFECDDPEAWTVDETDQIRRNLIGRTGIVVGLQLYVDTRDFSSPAIFQYTIVVPPYVPFTMWDRYLQPICGGMAFDALVERESCYKCCRAFPSQVREVWAVYKDYRLLLCRDCMLQEPTPQNCKSFVHKDKSDAFLHVLEDGAMQDLLVKTCVQSTRLGEEGELGDEYGSFLFHAVEEVSRSNLSCCVVSGLGWAHLASCVKLSRRLENAVYFHFPDMR